MNQPQILNIKMVPAGVELVLFGLAKLPYENVAALIAEIKEQADSQMQPMTQTELPFGEMDFIDDSEAATPD